MGCIWRLPKSRIGDRSGEIEDYSNAINLDPNDSIYYFNRGIAKKQKGDHLGAMDDLEKAGQLGDPDAYEQLRKLQGKWLFIAN